MQLREVITRILPQRLKSTYFCGFFFKISFGVFQNNNKNLRHSWLPKHCLLLPAENFPWEVCFFSNLRSIFVPITYRHSVPPSKIDGSRVIGLCRAGSIGGEVKSYLVNVKIILHQIFSTRCGKARHKSSFLILSKFRAFRTNYFGTATPSSR